MIVRFTQVYIEVGVSLPFSVKLQEYLGNIVSSIAQPSEVFLSKFDSSFNIRIYISAKRGIVSNEVCGPACAKRNKEIEYTIFLPFDQISKSEHFVKLSAGFIFDGICEVFDDLCIESRFLASKRAEAIDFICSSTEMIKQKEWDE